MKTDKNKGLLLAGILPGIPALVFGIIGLVCTIIGGIIMAGPDKVTIRVNGRLLEGAESVEYATNVGNILSVIGGIGLVLAVVFIAICVAMLLVYVSRSQAQQ